MKHFRPRLETSVDNRVRYLIRFPDEPTALVTDTKANACTWPTFVDAFEAVRAWEARFTDQTALEDRMWSFEPVDAVPMTPRLALERIRDARDFHAHQAEYPDPPFGPASDQCFDDWAADLAQEALR